jgi:hypothetical protein
MNVAELQDLKGRECVSIESGRGTILSVVGLREDDRLLYADMKVVGASTFEMNRIRHSKDDPAIREWHDSSHRIGTTFAICAEKQNVFRGNAFVHFNLPIGGVRLFFLPEYVQKFREKDSYCWDWDEMIEKASSQTDHGEQ